MMTRRRRRIEGDGGEEKENRKCRWLSRVVELRSCAEHGKCSREKKLGPSWVTIHLSSLAMDHFLQWNGQLKSASAQALGGCSHWSLR